MHIVRLTGDIDFRRVNETRQWLLQNLAESDGLVVDMSDVYRIDSAGLAGLIEVVQAARVSGRGFRLHRVRDGVRRMIKLARLDRIFLDAEAGGMIAPEGAAA
jgi:anti-anti-sigma factor